ncbi:MAG: polysaccharide biosynthesis protein [Proteobacteria bacterium]|nr:polysaccharide biosynthesis protein [Pseudomonadota bacterium]
MFRDQVILVTGAAGSIGQELVRQLLSFCPAEIRILDNNESALFLMSEKHRPQNNVTAYIGDVRDYQKVSSVANGTDMIFHCAALKHVYLSEYNPFDAVQTNILGVQNIVQAGINLGIKRVIFTSSDKAVNPTNVMGTTKLMGERLITAANIVNRIDKQRFSSVRFGNVIGSRGSVFSIFHEQIKNGGPVTITDPRMTRFIMSLEQAAKLVLEGAILARGGEVLVTKMEALSIMDLAQAMIELIAPYYNRDPMSIKTTVIGAKPGEKMYEELLSSEEMQRSIELEEMFVVLPAFRAIYRNIDYSYPGSNGEPVSRPYNSAQESTMSRENIKKFLINNKLLPMEASPNAERAAICAS